MTEKYIHNLIEQQDPEAKKRIWERVSARLNLRPKRRKRTPTPPQQITLFTYVNEGNDYVKRPITLHDLLVRLSDKNVDVAGKLQANNHSTE